MEQFEDKFQLSPEESRFLAKKKWDENVYCGMRMENRAVTFPQTKTILGGVNVPGVQLDDIQAILNLRDAWLHLLNTLDEPVNLDYLCALNAHVSRNESLAWGALRTGAVGISGTNYVPPIPVAEIVEGELHALLSGEGTATEAALNAFLWGCRSQLFWDGNKRTSLLLANKVLLVAGAGMLTITDAHMEVFNCLLTAFYSTGAPDELKAFLYDNCIQGITFA